MAKLWQSPILEESFGLIDAEFGPHAFSPEEYAVVRRVIHSTADFEFKDLVRFDHGAISAGLTALTQGAPIVVDVTMVRQGVVGLVERTFKNPLWTAVSEGDSPQPGRTRTETGLLRCLEKVSGSTPGPNSGLTSSSTPGAVVVIGNAPTALMALCEEMEAGRVQPALVIGAPVGFVAVEASKQRLAQVAVPQIRVEGRKGGSSVAAAILNALLVLAWEQQP
ncbi:precorrin-8X methylmutase [Phormidium sp. FACHB-1136]|uniref:precorrin-8X methylmutase n=1 Tax=Phormidium sp. FACHB-1136 TaxID=2692848 RepID=UPI001681D36C|nr:precorrin-8X methylmutase [Phormidium sp. FACHB-1136]MBD2424373.1 precorrin-8X methylmutase [Phormidium sp. FACHB-1136]